VSNRCAVLEASDDVEKAWNNFKDTVSAAAKNLLDTREDQRNSNGFHQALGKSLTNANS